MSTSFMDLLGRTKPAIEARLTQIFEDKARALRVRGAEVSAVVETAKSLTLRGGKRYRAGMLAAAYFAVTSKSGADRFELDDAVLGGGTALELLQSYLLIQDDWMDGDVERRGGPSAHIALAKQLGGDHKGASGAMLAGDLVWGLAIDGLTRLDAAPERKVRAIQFFTSIHEDVVVGQILDTLSPNADIEVLHSLKTGSYTVRGPVLLGAILGGANADEIAGFERFSEPLGVAFQLRDDLIGVFGSEAEAGRPEASDLRSAKNAAVMREARPHLEGKGKAAVDAVWGKADASPEAIRDAVAAIEATGARGRVEARLFELCGKAESIARSLSFSRATADVLAEGASALRAVPKGPVAR